MKHVITTTISSTVGIPTVQSWELDLTHIQANPQGTNYHLS